MEVKYEVDFDVDMYCKARVDCPLRSGCTETGTGRKRAWSIRQFAFPIYACSMKDIKGHWR